MAAKRSKFGDRECIVCRKQYRVVIDRQRFCSDLCRSHYHNALMQRGKSILMGGDGGAPKPPV